MVIKIGFKYAGFRYGWHNGHLYRLPTIKRIKNGFQKQYSLKKLNEIDIGRKKGFRILRKRMTHEQIELLNKNVNWKINVLKHES